MFHSISAFCNAGFDLLGREAPFVSVTGYTGDPLINLPIMLLITVGGLGFFVWSDLCRNRFRFPRLHIDRHQLLTKLIYHSATISLDAVRSAALSYASWYSASCELTGSPSHGTRV